jgi:succinyl-CoA synthetase beta subunit
VKLHEFQAKAIFASYAVPIPHGEVASSAAAAKEIALNMGGIPVVIKAQVQVGGRGKAGGIKTAHSAEEVEGVAQSILGMTINGLRVEQVLVEEAADIKQELYLAVAIDRIQRRPVMIVSAEGGVEIEEVARKNPEKIYKLPVDPLAGLFDFQAKNLAFELGLRGGLIRQFNIIAKGLFRAFAENDATLAEINPLAVNTEGKLVAIDGKMILDDNSLFRQPVLAALRDAQEDSEEEKRARLADINYVKLDGDIGCLVNGAGLAMATMDIVQLYGGKPANFLDIGGGANAEKVAIALEIILRDPSVKAILLNIFGGITRCDEVARGIIEALLNHPFYPPIVCRLVGTNETEGRKLLAEAQLKTAEHLIDAAQLAVKLAQPRENEEMVCL